MNQSTRTSAVAYGVALAALAAALLLRWLLDPVLGDALPLVTLFGAVAVAVWIGGYRPALLVVIFGYVACAYLFIEPRGHHGLDDARNIIGLFAYLVTSSIIIGFGESMRAAQRRAETRREALRTTLASIGDAVITTDTDGRITSLNAVAETLTGWANGVAVGQSLDAVFRIVNEETRKAVENPATRALREGVIVGLANHTVLIAKDGTERSIDDSAAPIRCGEGELVGCVLSFRDIGEQRRAIRAVEQSEARKTAMLETTLDCIISINHEGKIIEFNAAAERTFGHRREDVVGRELASVIIPPAFRERHRKGLAHYLATGVGAVLNQRLELSALRADGMEFPTELTVTRIPLDGPPIFTAYLRDITERQQAERALRESEERLRMAQRVSKIGTFEWNIQTGVNTWTPELEAMYGLKPGEFAGTQQNWEGLVHPEDRPLTVQRVQEAMVYGEFTHEWRVVWPDGRTHWLAGRAWMFKDDEGRPLRLLGVNIDITDRKQAEAALWRSEKDLADFFENASAGLHWVGPDGTILRVNQTELDLLGYKREEYVGRHIAEFHVDRPVIDDILARLTRGEELHDYPARLCCKDGSTRDVLIDSNVLFEDGQFIHTRCFTRDVSEQKRAEKARSEREEFVSGLLGSIDDAFMSLDQHWQVTFVNEQAKNRFRVSGADLLGKNIWERLPEVVGDETHTQLHRAMTDRVGVEYEVFYEPWQRWFFDKAYPTTDGGIAVLSRDMTERKRAEAEVRRSAELLTFLIDRSPSGFYIVDADFRISHINADSQARAFRNVMPAFGRRLDEAMRILWPEPLATEIIEIFRHTLDTGEPYRSPGLISPRHDLDAVETYEWQLERIIMPDGKYGVVCYYYDTTALRQAEQTLRDADRRKDEFLATLAHELRGPLAPIRNMLEILKRSDGDGKMLQQARDTMERQLGQMVRLVDDLLDVSRITRDKLGLRQERVELASVIYQSIEVCRPLAERANHDLKVTLPSESIYLHADAVRLTQVFGNILNNACKYTESSGKIWLTVERQGSAVAVSVKDTGTGIPPDKIETVFDLFTQVDRSLERSQGGLGIGLTLVKRLVEMHGGSVEAKSEGEGKGSEFVVHLPILIETPKKETSQPNAACTPSMPRRILVVDDNRDSATSLALLLKMSGNETHTAHDGLEALEAAEKFRPDVVLLDIGLPKLNGHEVCRRLRERPWGKNIVLVALTGWGQAEDRDKSRNAGFDHHMVKPVDHAALVSLLARRSKESKLST